MFAGYENLIIAAASGLSPEFEEFARRMASGVLGKCDLPLEHQAKITVPELTVTDEVTLPTSMSVESTEISWALATANWTNAAGNGSYVACQGASGRAGTGTGGSFNVYLPRSSPSVDPNVRSGTIIPYVTDSNGDRICVGSYEDDCIGSIKAWYGAVSAIKAGWALCDGSTYGSVTTPDLRSKFIVGAYGDSGGDDALGTGNDTNVDSEGGANTHSHSVSGTGAGAGQAGSTKGATSHVELSFAGSVETGPCEPLTGKAVAEDTYIEFLNLYTEPGYATNVVSAGNTEYTSVAVKSTGVTDSADAGLGPHPTHIHTVTSHNTIQVDVGTSGHFAHEATGVGAVELGVSADIREASSPDDSEHRYHTTDGGIDGANDPGHYHTITNLPGVDDTADNGIGGRGHRHTISNLIGDESGDGHVHQIKAGKFLWRADLNVIIIPPTHTHPFDTAQLNSHMVWLETEHTHDFDLSSIDVSFTGTSNSQPNVPTYYALAFIMRVN